MNSYKKTTLIFIPMFMLATQYNFRSTNSGQKLGNIICKDSQYGLICQINLHDIPPGAHGLHVHKVNSCNQHGMAAGGHFSLSNQKHLGPYNTKSHLGDLPLIFADKNGDIQTQIIAPRLNTKLLIGHSIIIHEFGDNYSEQPKPLGGGGSRIACAKSERN